MCVRVWIADYEDVGGIHMCLGVDACVCGKGVGARDSPLFLRKTSTTADMQPAVNDDPKLLDPQRKSETYHDKLNHPAGRGGRSMQVLSHSTSTGAKNDDGLDNSRRVLALFHAGRVHLCGVYGVCYMNGSGVGGQGDDETEKEPERTHELAMRSLAASRPAFASAKSCTPKLGHRELQIVRIRLSFVEWYSLEKART